MSAQPSYMINLAGTIIICGARKFVFSKEVQASQRIRWIGHVEGEDPRNVLVTDCLAGVFVHQQSPRLVALKKFALDYGAKFRSFWAESEIFGDITALTEIEANPSKVSVTQARQTNVVELKYSFSDYEVPDVPPLRPNKRKSVRVASPKPKSVPVPIPPPTPATPSAEEVESPPALSDPPNAIVEIEGEVNAPSDNPLETLPSTEAGHESPSQATVEDRPAVTQIFRGQPHTREVRPEPTPPKSFAQLWRTLEHIHKEVEALKPKAKDIYRSVSAEQKRVIRNNLEYLAQELSTLRNKMRV